MAAIGIDFSASIVDGVGQRGTVVSHVVGDDGQTVLQVKNAANAWATLFAGVSDANILSVNAKVVANATASGGGAGLADSRIYEVSVFDFLVGSTGKHYGQVTPAFLDSKLNTSHDPNLGDAAVQAWFQQFFNTHAVLGGTFSSPDRLDLGTALAYAFRSARHHRRAKRVTP